jgi:hypothetical protein
LRLSGGIRRSPIRFRLSANVARAALKLLGHLRSPPIRLRFSVNVPRTSLKLLGERVARRRALRVPGTANYPKASLEP